MIDLANTTNIQSSDHIGSLLRALVSFSNAGAGHLMRVQGEAFERTHSSEAVAGNSMEEKISPFQASLIRQALRTRKPVALLDTAARSPLATLSNGPDRRPLTCLSIPVYDDDVASFVIVVEAIENFDSNSSMILKATELFSTAFAAVVPFISIHRLDDKGGRCAPVFKRMYTDGPNSLTIEPAVLSGIAETIANEVNDPLSAVVSHSAAGLQWLNQDPPNLEKAKNSLRKIASSAFAVGRIISSYRASQLVDQGRVTHIPVNDVMTEALQYILTDPHSDKVVIDNTINSSAAVFGERRLVVQAVVNVLSACIGGLASTDGSCVITIRDAVKDGLFELRVSDNGKGAPVEARDAFFDPVYSLEAGNCGIKLAVARNIALLQGGALEISSCSDQGTTLVLKFPMDGS